MVVDMVVVVVVGIVVVLSSRNLDVNMCRVEERDLSLGIINIGFA